VNTLLLNSIDLGLTEYKAIESQKTRR